MEDTKKCPNCGYGWVHPVAVYVRTDMELHTITCKGHEVQSTFSTWPCSKTPPRGVIIAREYLGECGHRWLETEQFHKGEVFQGRMDLVSYVGPTETIWRN